MSSALRQLGDVRRDPLPSVSSDSKSDDRRDDRPAALSPEPADTSRRLWPHPGRVRSTQAAILTTERHAATTAAATAAQRREPRSRDFASSLLPFNESASKRRRKGTGRRPIRRVFKATQPKEEPADRGLCSRNLPPIWTVADLQQSN